MLAYLPLLADLVLACAALGATVYCMRLGRRLARFSSIDNGLGGAIAVLSRQVDEMNAALASARTGSAEAEARLDTLMADARRVSDRLEMLVAGCHDLAGPDWDAESPGAAPGSDAAADPTVTPGRGDRGRFAARPDRDGPARPGPDASVTPFPAAATAAKEADTPLFRHRMPGGR